MRLWHYELLPYISNLHLQSQWRELNSIFAKSDNHILINYVYGYPKVHLRYYALLVIGEMNRRGIKVRSMDAYGDYFYDMSEEDKKITPTNDPDFKPFPEHHDDGYLAICYFNLLEKFMRGQEGMDSRTFTKLYGFCRKRVLKYAEDTL